MDLNERRGFRIVFCNRFKTNDLERGYNEVEERHIETCVER